MGVEDQDMVSESVGASPQVLEEHENKVARSHCVYLPADKKPVFIYKRFAMIGQEHNGAGFSATISGRRVAGLIRCQDNSGIFLLQQHLHGCFPTDGVMWGYQGSWQVGSDWAEDSDGLRADSDGLRKADVTHFKVFPFPSEGASLHISRRLWERLQKVTPVKVKEIACDVRFDLPASFITDTIMALPVARRESDPNSFDIRAGELSYFSGVQPVGGQNKWAREGRQTMKPTKLLKILKEFIYIDCELNEEEEKLVIGRFFELLAGSLTLKATSAINVSPNVHEIYIKPTASRGVGSLGDSCMRPESSYSCCELTDNFDEIPNLQVAYMEDSDGRLKARALLWECYSEDLSAPIKVMDRIYGSEESIEAFKEWAEQNGYYHKVHQNSCTESFILDNTSTLRLRAEAGDATVFPYMDSFSTYYNDRLYTYTSNGICLQSTSGTNIHGKVCNNCGETGDEDYGHYISEDRWYCCEDCANESGWYTCNSCGEWYHEDDEHPGGHCSESCAESEGWYSCCWCGDSFHEDEGVGGYCCAGCAERDGYFSCPKCGEVFDKDDGTGEYCSDGCAVASGDYANCENCDGVFPIDELEDNKCTVCVNEHVEV